VGQDGTLAAPPVAAAVAPTPLGAAVLPPLSFGRAIRLTSLAITERTVDGRTVPSVALTDAASKARLDELLASATRDSGRCRIRLALETLVSMKCVHSYFEPAAGGPITDHIISHYRVGVNGDVELIQLPALMHPGTNEFDLIKRLLNQTEMRAWRVVATDTGLEFSQPSDDSIEPIRLPWRAVAPYVRADGPLGAALAAEGVPLAPVGMPMPPLPPQTLALRSSSIGDLLLAWTRMPAALRPEARLWTGELGSLVFPHTFESAAVQALKPANAAVARSFETTVALAPVMVRATAPLELRDHAGPRGEVHLRLPAGTVLPAARGLVGTSLSDVTPRDWTAVAAGAFVESWVRGRDVALVDAAAGGCVPELPTSGSDWAQARGVVDWTRGGVTSRAAWFVARVDSALSVRVHGLEGCIVGAEWFRVPLTDRLAGIAFGATAREGGDSLLLLVQAPASSPGAKTLRVFGANGSAPLLERDLGAGTVDSGLMRGPDGAQAFFPLRVTPADAASGPATYYSWANGVLTEVAAE
jgi:hypothetical protein